MAENTENTKKTEDVTPETDQGKKTEEEVFSSAGQENQADKKVTTEVADFEEFDESHLKNNGSDDRLNFLKDLQLNVYIELGRTNMMIKDMLELERGYVIELDKLASEPVDIFVNNKKIAEGEVVVIDKHFGIRITNLIDTKNALKGMY
jgi:flagellar motor switch protein FliN/FliY